MISRIALSLVLILASMWWVAAADYRFIINEKPVADPIITPLSDGDHPAPGDLLNVYGTQFVLDGPGLYEFKYTNGQLTYTLDGSEPAPVMIELDCEATNEKDADGSTRYRFRDRLKDLTEAQRGRIRHLVFSMLVGESMPDLTTSFVGIDWSRVMVTIKSDDWVGESFAWLPASIRQLVLDPNSQPNSIRFADFARFSQLRYLYVSGVDEATGADLGVLAGMTHLRHLEISFLRVPAESRLPPLPSLRFLRITNSKSGKEQPWPGSIEQIAGASQVEDLTVSASGITSLAALSWARLRSVRFDETPIRELPLSVSTSLRRLDLYGAPIPAAEVMSFRREHPEVALRVAWSDALEELVGCDRIILRTGGTCHRSPSQEKELWSSNDRQQVTNFLATLEIDDRRSGHHCMCCGSATVELHQAGQVKASFGMHHGVSVRWLEGPWPGDASLTRASRDLLASWLSDRGETSTADELRAEKERETAHERHANHWRRVLGPTVIDDLWASASMAAARTLVTSRLPVGDERSTTQLRLSGGVYPSWRVVTVFDQLLGSEEDSGMLLDPAEIGRVLARLPEDNDVRDGLCRQLFGWRRLGQVDAASLAIAGPVLARHGLRDPRPENRLDVIHTLAEVGTSWCREVLRDALVAQESRPLPADAVATPGGQVTYLPRKVEIPDECSVPAAAALALLYLRDQPSLPAISALVGSLPEAERALVTAKLALQKGPSTTP